MSTGREKGDDDVCVGGCGGGGKGVLVWALDLQPVVAVYGL